MTEELIIEVLAKYTDERRFPYQLPRSFIYNWECDFWTMTGGGETREFEIKISRSDYLIDAKKDKHSKCELGANYFYYVCPEGMISKDEVDKRYGLIYVTEAHRIILAKKPRKLNNNVFKEWKMLANKMYWKWYSLWMDMKNSKQISREQWAAGFKPEPPSPQTPKHC